jgi:hypothetical protein
MGSDPSLIVTEGVRDSEGTDFRWFPAPVEPLGGEAWLAKTEVRHQGRAAGRGAHDKNAAAAAKAHQAGTHHLIWQDPDHEALLLRHLPNCQNQRPPPGRSFDTLRRHWPQYEKGMSAQQLAEHIGIEQIRLACAVEPVLRALLIQLKLLHGS